MGIARKFRALLAFALASASASASAFPFSYAGRLTDASDRPIAGPVELSVKFFAGKTDANALGTQEFSKKDVVLTDGVFQLDFDIADANAATIFSDPANPVYVEVRDETHKKTYP